MLEHAHTDHFIEDTIRSQVAVVLHLDAAAVGEPCGADTLTGGFRLWHAQSNAERVDPVAFSGVLD